MLTGIYHQHDVRPGHRCITREAKLADQSVECFAKTLRELLAAVAEATINEVACGNTPTLPITFETKVSTVQHPLDDLRLRVDAWVPNRGC